MSGTPRTSSPSTATCRQDNTEQLYHNYNNYNNIFYSYYYYMRITPEDLIFFKRLLQAR